MKTDNEDDDLDPAERVRQIKALFRSVRNTLSKEIAAIEDPSPADAKKLSAKLNELQSVHVSLVRAEEAFHEKTKADGQDDKPDFDAIRAAVGSALDRIRKP